MIGCLDIGEFFGFHGWICLALIELEFGLDLIWDWI